MSHALERSRPRVALIVVVCAAALVAVLAGQIATGLRPTLADPLEVFAWLAFSAAVSLTVGVLELARYATRGDRPFAIIGVALGAAGLARGSQLVLALPALGTAALLTHSPALGVNGFASRLLLPALVVAGSVMVPAGSRAKAARPPGLPTFAVLAATLAAAAATVPWLLPLPAAASTPSVIARPGELLAAPLFLLALLTVWRSPDLAATSAGQGLAAALVVGCLDQLLVEPFVRLPFGSTAALGEAVHGLSTVLVAAGVIVNIASMTRRERELARTLRAEIARRSRTEQALAREAARYSRSNEELQQFAYVASHDLQEPLRMVTSYLQLIERRYDHLLDDDGREFMHFAVDGAVRMKGLINDLLTYSRVGTRAKEPVLADLGAALQDALRNLEVALAESGTRVEADPLPSVWADPAQLTQLLQNLLANAIKFRRDGVPPHVRIAAERDGGQWHLTVRDNGIGVDPRYRERVFGVFQRLHGDDRYPGSGIGLAVCRKIVERSDGRIWLDSSPDQGTTVHLLLPQDRPEREGDTATATPADPELDQHVRSLIERALELV